MDLRCDAPTVVVLTPDTASAQTFLPEPVSLRDCLLFADRGYIDLGYLHRVSQQGLLYYPGQSGDESASR